jgi:hypothetical protein
MTGSQLSKPSPTAVADLSGLDDIVSQLGSDPDAPSRGLGYVVHAQPMSHALVEANFDKFIPNLKIGDYAIPTMNGDYALFPGSVGIRFLVAQMVPIHVKHLHDGSTEMLPRLVSYDLLEKVLDEETGYKIYRLHSTQERIESQWLVHGLFEGQYPATRRYKGSNYKTGTAINNIVANLYLNGKFCPMLTLFHETSRFVQGAQGPRYEASVKALGKLGALGGPPTTWSRKAIELRLSLLGGAPFQATDEIVRPDPPDPPAEIEAPKSVASGPSNVISDGWDRSAPFGGPDADDEPIPF